MALCGRGRTFRLAPETASGCFLPSNGRQGIQFLRNPYTLFYSCLNRLRHRFLLPTAAYKCQITLYHISMRVTRSTPCSKVIWRHSGNGLHLTPPFCSCALSFSVDDPIREK